MRYSEFATPRSFLRPAPFWAINDRITPEETARQMSDMLDVGLSGGFFHSRAGLTTDYLGAEWFAAMEGALQVAREQDGYVWLYDEDLWPSGNAGGQVAGMRDDFRAAQLVAVLLAPGEEDTALRAAGSDYRHSFSGCEAEEDTAFRAAYAIRRDGMTLLSAEPIDAAGLAARADDERLLFLRTYTPKTGWWGGESYANLLHPEAMEQFRALTHEVYARHLQQEFGARVPGIFTDEPQIAMGRDALPWYEGFPAVYAAWTGRDFWADLPYLFFEGPECRVIRLLVHRALLRQFTEAFTRPLFAWCQEHQLAHTGHFNAEESLSSQIYNHGGGVMAHYRYQQIPGVDHLCRETTTKLLTHKQASSAARQLGRRYVLTEIFGVSRHTNTFEEFKWLGDYNLVLGSTLFCPHLTLYSARGRRKRDYPPNWNYQQTYWHELRPLNDYFTRLGAALTSGTAQAEVLVLHPVESGTAGHRFAVRSSRAMPGEDMNDAERFDRTFRTTVEAVLNAGYDCDLGDEGYLEDLGSVEGDRLRVGEMRYGVVLVPPSRTWRPSTYRLLGEFAAGGGTLIFLGELPDELDARPAQEAWRTLAAQARHVPCATVQLQDALDKVVRQPYRLRDPEGQPVPQTYMQARKDELHELFFIVNGDRAHAQAYTFTYTDPQDRPLAVWDALTGARYAVAPARVGAEQRFTFTLPPAGSLLLARGAGAAEEAAPWQPLPELAAGQARPLPATWAFARSEENVLVMDRLSYSLDGGRTWSAEDLEFRVRKQLAEHFGTASALEWQPWVAIRKGLFEGKGGEVILRYRFHNALERRRPVMVVIEDLARGAVSVNGRPIDSAGAGWQWDRGFGKVEITDLLQPGENVVDFRVHYDFLTEVEAAYLVGDFGVRLRDAYTGELVAEPASLQDGSWVEQGYPFYSGSMRYRTAFAAAGAGRLFLRLQRASGILYKVRVNEREVGSMLWHPHAIELTPAVQPGENRLEIEVIASRQNTLGPLHEWQGDDNRWVGPNAFEEEGAVREAFSLFDYGLLGGAELVTLP